MFEYPLDGAFSLAERLREAERKIAVLHGVQLRLMAQLYARAPEWITAAEDTPGLVDAAEVAAAEIGVALRVSRRAAMDRLGLALSLRYLPDIAAALGRGELSLSKARIITDAVGDLTAEAAAQVQARVLPRAPGQTPAGLGASVARAVLAADPTAAARRRAQAVRERTVRFCAGPDGMGSQWARLPAEDALGCYRELCELADLATPTDEAGEPIAGPDGRAADARRADTLIDLIMGATCAHLHQQASTTPGADTDTDTGSAGTDTSPPGRRTAGRARVDVSRLDHAGRTGRPTRLAGRLRPYPPPRRPPPGRRRHLAAATDRRRHRHRHRRRHHPLHPTARPG